MLEKISIYQPSKGINIEAYTDGYSHDEYGNLYIMSILGYDSAVKGISSGIVTMKEIRIQGHDIWEIFSVMRGKKYRIMSARFESGLLHQIVVMDEILIKTNPDSCNKLIYVGKGGDIKNILFNEIRSNFGTPMLSEWKNWLFTQIHNEGLIEIMEGNVKLARLSLNEKQLDSIISKGVAQQSIRF